MGDLSAAIQSLCVWMQGRSGSRMDLGFGLFLRCLMVRYLVPMT